MDLVLVAFITAPILVAALVALVWWLIADLRRERRRTRVALAAAAARRARRPRPRSYTHAVLYSHNPDLLTHQRPHWPTRDPDADDR
ncbi:hypothetical protein [Actinokineospora sp. UTMC 2448]|uniref:hypothetical protein n=1 Tax=Actinokineospora sp. UTMC 2448 TaxID=2268449 RepID=UPI0021648CB4|nr:hypothetical protein [Actinokineospora sp. UTMC 2448]